MPVFNEDRWLDASIRRVIERPEVAELVVVDDGSTDGSSAILHRWQEKEFRIRVHRHDHNRGKGAAIRTALTHVNSPIVLIQDADLEYSPSDYPDLLGPVIRGEAEVVYGSRFLGKDNANPVWHTLGNRVLTAACNFLTGLRLTDEATCYKLFAREVVEQLHLTENGFGFCPEVTAKLSHLVRAGTIRLQEVPITYHGRNVADGKKIRLRDGLMALRCLWMYSR
jgi:glycosyltransferase involved in cell wall biosynthesis